MIPLTIWQTYKTTALPAPARQCQVTWRALNPDCQYVFADDAGIDAFVKTHGDARFNALYRAAPLGVMRADLWRYLVLLVHGGVYTDIDTECRVPVSRWLSHEAVIGLETDENFCQWTLACAPGHPLMKKVVAFIVDKAWREGIDTTTEHFVHHTTGPVAFTNAIAEFVGMPGASARQIHDRFAASLAPAATRFMPQNFFQGSKVFHRFGSKTFPTDYDKWVDLRHEVPKGKIILR